MTEHAFQADTTRVLGLVIDSLYSDKEIFLRELVSNAADALDKLRFRALTEPDLLAGETRLFVRIAPDAAAGTLSIEDSGAGMTEAELVEHLGTIARSGTRGFLEKLDEAKKKDVALIGQFGVGFYSSFLVADRVEVVSRAAGTESAARWASAGKDSFTIDPAERAARGTTVVLHLKEEQKQFLDPFTLRSLVRRFSDFVSYPIELVETKDGETKNEQINRGSAPWQEQPASLDVAKHEELYKHLTHDWEAPLAHSHFRIEGALEYVALLYVPKHAPEMLFDPQKAPGLKLFVKRVLVLDECDLLLPPYLRFVRGLVDSDDLPLNVSRELLQDSSALRTIQKQLVKRVLDLLEGLSTDKADDFETFSKCFGSVLKEGLASGADVSARLAKLVRFGSTVSAPTSLTDYVSRMKEGQEAIYYATADNVTRLESAPQLEALRAKGFEVLLGTEPIDEFAIERLGEFEGKKLVSALRADLKLGESEDDKKRHETEQSELAPLLAAMKKILEGRVSDVVPSARLTDSPACLVLGKAAMPAHLEKLFRQRGHKLPEGQRVLELNAGHPLVKSLLALATKDANSTDLKNWTELLCDQAALAEGSELPDPARFAQSVAQLLTLVAAEKLVT